jgi:hypothetical protein
MGTASWVSALVYAAAKVGIADHLAGGPKSAAEAAPRMHLHPPTLHRFMRTLAGLGILVEKDDQRFAPDTAGRGAQDRRARCGARHVAHVLWPTFWRTWEHLKFSLETGKSAFALTWGMPIFDYFGQHPEEAALFSESMVGFHGAEPLAVAEAYDFSPFEVVDRRRRRDRQSARRSPAA